MTDQISDLHRAKRGVAVLVACVVRTMRGSDPHAQERFLDFLGQAYAIVRDDWEGDVIQELELLTWTREYLTGESWLRGQEEPLLPD